MLRTLLESKAPPQRRRAGTAVSIFVHTTVIASAVVASASAKPERQHVDVPERPPIYVGVPEPKEQLEQRPVTRPTTAWFDNLLVPRRIVLGPVPVTPSALPVDIDPSAWLSSETLAGIGPRGLLGGQARGPILGDEPATALTVDVAAALLAPPRPRYPDQLRAAGVTGRVVVRLVVDASGRVEPSSVVIREASHDLFARAVRAVVPLLRFKPAEVAGRRVRMLVDLPFEFRLNE